MALLFRLKLKQNRNEPKQIVRLIAAFYMIITSQHVEAPDAEALRVLSVGVRGQSSVSIADLLSGNKEQELKDGEIVKTPVMTDEGRRLTLVTGPNLCEEDTARQSFTTALFLSSPGPHAVLMLLHLEDPQAEPPCDLLQQAQELLGAEVLQYCIVLLQQNQQERLTGASRGIAGDMINACGGRFHIIPDAQSKPAALLEEIDKLVWLNDGRFYSALNKTHLLHIEKQELLRRLQEIDAKLEARNETQQLKSERKLQIHPINNQMYNQCVNEEKQLLSIIYDFLGGAFGVVGWIFLISLIAHNIFTKGRKEIEIFVSALGLLMIYLRYFLSADVAIPLNLALITSVLTAITFIKPDEKSSMTNQNTSDPLRGRKSLLYLFFSFMYLVAIAYSLVIASFASIRSWSDVLTTCCAAPGVTFCALNPSFIYSKRISSQTPVLAFALFLFYSVGAMISMRSMTVLAQLGVEMSINLLILAFPIACFQFKSEIVDILVTTVIFLLLSWCCVLVGSVFSLWMTIMTFLKIRAELKKWINHMKTYL